MAKKKKNQENDFLGDLLKTAEETSDRSNIKEETGIMDKKTNVESKKENKPVCKTVDKETTKQENKSSINKNTIQYITQDNNQSAKQDIKKEDQLPVTRPTPLMGRGGKKGTSIAEIKRILDEKKKAEEEFQEMQRIEEERIKLENLKIKNEFKEKEILKKTEEKKVETKIKSTRRFAFKMKNKKEDFCKEESEITVSGNLKSPICCILGHVDTGKTKLLDKLRETNIQGAEAGGITQQIGATYFPLSSLLKKFDIEKTDLPGVLIIDTPGHESFSNLRSRGSSLCNLAILVVDILHLLEPQTLESIQLLKQRKTPFLVALNKIDRIYGWKPNEFSSFDETFKKQPKNAQIEFTERLNETIIKFSEISLNARLYSENPDRRKFISLIPTSAITGEGIPDLIRNIVQLSENFMVTKMKFKETLECTILEVKNVEGYGTTVDVILANGSLKEGDKICVCGFEGPIVTTIKALLVPQPLRELRLKSNYMTCKVVKASLGVKISALDLEKAVAGTRILFVEEDIEKVKTEVMQDLESVISNIKTSEIGVHVQTSTLGSLEALVSFLQSEEIPISSVSIGNVRKKDVIITSSILEKNKDFAVMLCFDVKIDKEIYELANSLQIKIFHADIIYHLLDQLKRHFITEKEKIKKENLLEIIYPVKLKILPNCVFNKRSPLILGVCVEQGILKIGTPVCVFKEEIIKLGNVTSIELNKKKVEEAKKGSEVAIKIEIGSDTPKMFGRHFVESDFLYSVLTRKSIDILKKHFKSEFDEEDVNLIVELKRRLSII
ncbi:translation initiation factor 5B [Hamiltosporidium tvaerminnensis]|uniref:Eukaryotic translation initiation factor 5B n=2 Tax=Hamiltosporidium TaxID=1176354 RepID=A0A4Q9LWT2_9MICR|nr:translation initiation factor 5B [Hamiltosporidium tvaerminnensis]